MAPLESSLFTFGLIGTFASIILYVVFGQYTVRKLRKKIEFQDQLGLELVSGWDIINVAQALSLPSRLSEKLQKSPIGGLYANTTILYQHTTAVDRLLAASFYWILTFSGMALITLVILDGLGVFP